MAQRYAGAVMWVPIFDTANSWPSDPAAVWALGYRAFAAYAGSEAWKAIATARLAQWRAAGFAVAPMFEASGDEPLTSPTSGTAHARAARAAWTGRGCPPHVAISYPVDRNATPTQIKGSVARYFELVLAAEGFPQIAYIENDGADWLTSQGLIAGGFTPAAASWGDPPVLVTPANAGPHVLWTQEHNDSPVDGAQVDAGHIRTTAPIWWPTNTLEDDVTPADLAAIAETIWTYKPGWAGLRNETPLGMLNDSAQSGDAVKAALASLPAAVLAALPAGTLTKDDVEAALKTVISGLTATVTVTP